MRPLMGYGGVLLAILLWGTSFAVGQTLAAHFSPWTLSTWRFTLAALLAGAVAWGLEGDRARVPPASWGRIVAMGTLGHGAFSLCFFWGLQGTPPAVAAVVSGMEPLTVMLMGCAYFRQRLPVPVLLGTGVSLVGAILAASPGGAAPAGTWLGPALMGLSTVCFGVYTLLGKEVLAHLSPLALTAATMRWSLPALWGATLAQEGRGVFVVPGGADLLRLGYFAVGVSLLAFVGWNVGIKHLGINRTAIYGNGIPVVAVLFAALTGSPAQPHQWLGLALVVGGVATVQRHDPRA